MSAASLPLAPRCPARLGRDYREIPAQRAAALKVIEAHNIVIAGPIELLQGGHAFIARAPVYAHIGAEPHALWGIVSAVMDRETFYREISLPGSRLPLTIAIRGADGSGAGGQVFFGQATLFEADVVQTTVNLPTGSWVLAGRPVAGWLAKPLPMLWLVRGASVALSVFLVAFSRLRMRQQRDVLLALQAASQSEAKFRRSQQDLINAIESLSEGFALWGGADRLQVYNQRFVELMPAVSDVVEIGMTFERLARHLAAGGEAGADHEVWIAKRLAQHRAGDAPLEVRTDAGRHVQISERQTPDGYVVGLYADITEIRQAEAHIRYRAFYDLLTELPNRENFMNQLAGAIALAERANSMFALMFIDLDRFKNINDTLGHETGDLLLQEAAKRICASVRHTDTVARFGGDEFTVILRDIDDPLNAAHGAQAIIARLADSYQLCGHIVHTGASIGITVFPADGRDAHRLLRNADMAMYQAKARGRNTYQFFTTEMTQRAEQFVALEKDLRHSVGSAEFDFHYQAVFRLDDGALAGAEALMRWQHPHRGMVSPAEFIPVAEETRLIVELGA